MTGSRSHPELRTRAIATAGGLLFDALLGSCRFSTEGEENYERFWREGRPVVFVLWHGRLLPCTYRHRGQGLVTLISEHRDGEYIARVVQRWGYEPVRGSSSRGGTRALRQLVRHVRNGRSLAVTPDGPRGPRERMKPGALLAAQLSGAPLVPVAAGASRGWWFGRWDRFLLPKPFSHVRMAYGEAVVIPAEGGEEALADASELLERRLGELMRRVDAR